MSEIEIPKAAFLVAWDVFEPATEGDRGRDYSATVEDAVRAAAPLIVAAELRRLADELDVRREEMRTEDDRTVRSSGLGEGTRRIRERAAELDPQGGQ